MEAPARNLVGKNLGPPDEPRSFDKGKMDVEKAIRERLLLLCNMTNQGRPTC